MVTRQPGMLLTVKSTSHYLIENLYVNSYTNFNVAFDKWRRGKENSIKASIHLVSLVINPPLVLVQYVVVLLTRLDLYQTLLHNIHS